MMSGPPTRRETRLRMLTLLIDRIPDQWWTQRERDRWLDAFITALDLAIDVRVMQDTGYIAHMHLDTDAGATAERSTEAL